MDIRFKLRDVLWFVTVFALVLIVVISNRKLSVSNSKLEEMESKYKKIYAEFSEHKAQETRYRTFYKMGCEYLDHDLYKEALSCFESAKQVRMENEVLDKIFECFDEGGNELIMNLNDAELKSIFGNMAGNRTTTNGPRLQVNVKR